MNCTTRSFPPTPPIYAVQDSMPALSNPLAIHTRALAARAGRTVGRTAATRVAQLLN